jgi:hypothetical protein
MQRTKAATHPKNGQLPQFQRPIPVLSRMPSQLCPKVTVVTPLFAGLPLSILRK